MTNVTKLTVGTRASQMALAQTGIVIQALKARSPDIAVTVTKITTKGDVTDTPIPLDTVGKAWFTKEIEQALIDGTIDFAVHSLKDLPPETPPGLAIVPVLVRDDPRDVLVCNTHKTLAQLPKGAIIGTDSLRRKALLLQQRPDVQVKSVRGNANTRLQKMQHGEYDALVMAAAGLERIQCTGAITEYFDPTVFVPAIGQGALAIEVRVDQPEMRALFSAIQDETTLRAIAAERAFAEIVGGGCKLPVACYVHFENDLAYIHGLVGSMDAAECSIQTVSGPASDAVSLAEQLARELAKEPFVADYNEAVR